MTAQREKVPNPPHKLTDAVQDSICRTVLAGSTLEAAAAQEMLSPSTVYRWYKDGSRMLQVYPDLYEEHPLRKFALAVDQAKAMAEIRNVALIQQAAQTRWQAAAWWLERSNPEKWAANRLEIEKLSSIEQKLAILEKATELGLDLKVEDIPDDPFEQEELFQIGLDKMYKEENGYDDNDGSTDADYTEAGETNDEPDDQTGSTTTKEADGEDDQDHT